MRYLSFEDIDISNGKDIGSVLWVSGCSHHCPQCHNPQTWDINSGELFTEDTLKSLLEKLKRPYIKRLTFSGGDPLHLLNRECVGKIAKEVKEKLPEIKLWCYTGYRFEEIKEWEYLKYIDVLVDGEFEFEKRDITLAFCGSSNQRIIDVPQTLKNGRVVLEEIC